MDLQRIRNVLPPGQRDAVDLKAAWLRYLGAGGLDEEDAFESWLAEQYPHLFEQREPLAEMPVEVSMVLPSRFATRVDVGETVPDAARTVADHEARTITSERNIAPAPEQVPKAHSEFHYVLIGTAGKGGMGTVHVAKDTELLRRVALKQLSPEADAHVSARARFLREVQITAQLDHPNIVPVYALELAPGGMPAYTMKFVEGKTFHALLNEARDFFESGKRPDEARSLAARIEHFLKVCDAMAYAHDKGVIHRDLKPANLMLGRHNEVYVMDWGLCRAMRQPEDMPPERSIVMASPDTSGGASETQVGDVVGTPKYMSPEQAQGRNRELDARTDQCALGLILYEIVTLKPPYDGNTAYEVLINAAAGRRRPVVHAYLGKRRVPRELVAIIERATALSPDQRYASVAELAADLRRYLRGDAVQARADNLWQRTQRAVARHRQRVLTGILVLITLAAVAIGGLLYQNQQLFKAERQREQRLLELRDSVAAISSRVQTRMVELEGAIQNLSDSVAQIYDFGTPVENRFFLLRDFRDPQNAPRELIPSKEYGGHISLRWPVWTIPPGLDDATALPTIRRLSALQHFRREIYHRAAAMIKNKESDMYSAPSPESSEDAYGNPLVAIVLGLDNGISSRYPGWDGLPEVYDPREQPWYRLAEGKAGPQWSDPYFSATTRHDELAMSVPLYDKDLHFIGVVSALLDPDLMVRSLLDVHSMPGVHSVFLIDGRGHILAAEGQALKSPAPAADDTQVNVFPVPELVQRAKAHQTGILETRLEGQPVVLAFDEIDPLGWNVVAVASPAALFNAATVAAPR